MNKSQLVRDLQHRLSTLLEDSVFAKARQDRSRLRVGNLEDTLITHNISVSEEILQLDASSVNGVIIDQKIDTFRGHINDYLEKNGTGNQAYNKYIAIISEYLALVVRQPLHPPKVRHLENDPPEDTDRLKYCSWKGCYSKDKHSLCRYCNCMPWPEAN